MDDLCWTLLGREVMFEDRWMGMDACRYALPGGREIGPYYVSHPHQWAAVIPILPSGELVMVAQYRCGVARVTWEFPAGNIDPQEVPAEAAVRELFEETGCRPLEVPTLIAMVRPEPAHSPAKGYGFLCPVEAVELSSRHADTDECLEVLTCTVEEVMAAQREGVFCHAAHLSFFYQALYEGHLRGQR